MRPARTDADAYPAPAPPTRSLPALARAARRCRACPLWQHATQTVFGAGSARASVLFVGEQPGDKEDLEGAPFVGPAGRLLDESLAAAGIERGAAYVTNAVKHFKWEPRGKRRIHKKPSGREIAACRPWLDAEIAAVKPRVIVALGATAAQALLGPAFRVTKDRGRALPGPGGAAIVATVHPSSLLRAPDRETRHREIARFVADLKAIAKLLGRD